MDLLQLKIFATVVQTGSFSKAALVLGISQSAVSRAIASLEDELKVVLISRGRFGAKATRLGEKMLGYSQQILHLRKQMDFDIAQEQSLQGGRVRLASFRSAATHILPPTLAKFNQRFPKVEMTLTEADPQSVVHQLRQGDVDIGVIPLPRTADDLEMWDIARDEYVLLLPNTEQTIPDPVTWSALSDYSYILLNDAECTKAVRDHWKHCGQSLQVSFQIKEDSTIVSMVAQGLGAAILPRLAALPIPDSVIIRSIPAPLERRIGVAILSQVMHSPAVLTFLNLIRSMHVPTCSL
ncbi:MAG: LysR family transcriptional regulator [Acaryochloridaceae cyanobacterium RL_2_7]|nr:LysR family transcriptional regulator [Acaryochloridaceae cyanobacterium RL_2_7]